MFGQRTKVCQVFAKFEIALLRRPSGWDSLKNIPSSNFTADFVRNQWEYRKSLTCSAIPLFPEQYSSVCWDVCIDVGYPLSVLRFRACSLLPKQKCLQVTNSFAQLFLDSTVYRVYTVIYSFLREHPRRVGTTAKRVINQNETKKVKSVWHWKKRFLDYAFLQHYFKILVLFSKAVMGWGAGGGLVYNEIGLGLCKFDCRKQIKTHL